MRRAILLLTLIVPLGCQPASEETDQGPDTEAALADSQQEESKPEPNNCPDLWPSTAERWTGHVVPDSVLLRTGPSDTFPPHDSGHIYSGETVYVLQDCEGWAQGRAVTRYMVGNIERAQGEAKARKVLTFWLPVAAVERER